jgi:hypothetical protein
MAFCKHTARVSELTPSFPDWAGNSELTRRPGPGIWVRTRTARERFDGSEHKAHRTVYRFGGQVSLNHHRFLLRPRESRDLRLLSNVIHLTPLGELTWAQDVFGNSVATANFTGSTDSLVVESLSEVELTSTAWPVFPVSASAISYPFRYTDEEWMDLGALVRPQ